ncbi:MAG: diaminopimelate epimerase [Lachnospiraceae bacterium]|nr:diaminopimelate epimerase [Lachnospiraceae bacterium]
MKFTKMHGCGNDYVYVNGFEEHIPDEKKSELAIKVSNRNFGIGSDGLIFINPGKTAEFEMEMYNADGSRSEMCGNGIRCVGKYIYDHKLSDKTEITVESAGAVKYLTLFPGNDGKIEKVRVNMGSPILESKLVPVVSDNEKVIDEKIDVKGKEYRMTCVSMGNPHAVVFMDDVKDLDIEKLGPYFENHERFPKRTNTEFVQVIDRSHVFMRVWERGTGETLACGTGCCATAVACVLNGLTDESVDVNVLGGHIQIEWDRQNDIIYMTGPAKVSFEGEYKADLN